MFLHLSFSWLTVTVHIFGFLRIATVSYATSSAGRKCYQFHISALNVMSEFPKVVSNHVNIIELRFVNQITIFSIPEWVHNYEWFWIKNRAGEATLSIIKSCGIFRLCAIPFFWNTWFRVV